MSGSFAISLRGVQGSDALGKHPHMGLLDSLVDANFKGEQARRVVTFPGDRRNRGYVVKSALEEVKIRSFLKMFYCAQLSILFLGFFLASDWARELSYALGRPFTFLLRTAGITLASYLVVVGIPSWLLWGAYKKAFLSFVSVEDEVVDPGKSALRRPWVVAVGLIALGGLVILGTMFVIRATSVTN